ncbi:MAG: hypothetical protein K1X94_16565 [Sandaracinaceae bacterium]|nr:hypothetical protein [Sandaracinaceae bacterium]
MSDVERSLRALLGDAPRGAALIATLAARGVGEGDRVVIQLPITHVLEALAATVALGAIAVPVAPHLAVGALADQVRRVSARAIVTTPLHARTCEEARALAPSLEHIVSLDALPESGTSVSLPPARAITSDTPVIASCAPPRDGELAPAAIHDAHAMVAAAEALASALSLRTDDLVDLATSTLPGSGGLAISLSLACLAGSARARSDRSDGSILVIDAAALVAETARRVREGRAPRLVLGLDGPIPLAAACELVAASPGLEIARAVRIRELPFVLAIEPVARGAEVRSAVREGAIDGVELRATPDGHVAVRGALVPRAWLGSPSETASPADDRWLVSVDRGEPHARGGVRAGPLPTAQTALEILEAELPPAPSPRWQSMCGRREIAYPIGCGRGASIALEAGLKPLLRELIAVPELALARARFEAQGFVVEVAPITFGPTLDGWLGRPESREGTPRAPELERQPLFVARDRATARAGVEAELTRSTEGTRALGQLLGYPPCCVEAFASVLSDRRAHVLWAAAAARTTGAFRARLAALDHATFSYVSWFPCRFDCAPSLAYADALAARVARAHPDFVHAIDHALARPRLVLSPEVQLLAEGRVADEPEGRGVRALRGLASAACVRDPRVPIDPRLEQITARALSWLDGARELAVIHGTLHVDRVPRPLALDAPLPLLLPFGP